ncbi:gp58-like family protein [Enterococcus faecium]|uniref:gp58-like family protein n=1 Tax=Enterococcus faecium TaxID=1352 RepID=UPI0020906D58|nr:gp58-like family protein [Enterococcus faecium]
MLVTSDEIKAAWLKPSRQLSIRVNINGTTYGSEDITSLSFDSGSISGETYQIGSTYMNSVKIVFPSIIESIKEDIEVIPELAILLEGEYQYTKLGHFFVSEFDRDRNSNKTTITANDKMMYMESVFESNLTYPKPYREVALEIANLSGVEVNQASFSSLGISSIAEPEGYTYRQAIGLIAQFEGGFASFNRDGELEIRRLAPTSFEVTPESYLLKGFTKNEVSYRIGGISVKTGEEETDVIRVGSLNGSQVILENKVMTQSLLDIMWNLVKDINYFPYELKWRGCPPLEAGDWFYVEDKDGKRYSVPNLSYSMTFNGGLTAESKATTNSSSQATYKYRGPLSQRVDYLDSILSANKWNSNYYDQTEPTNPKEGDIWFKPNGQDTEIWVYRNVDGNLKWVMEITSAGDPELAQAIEEAKQAGEQAKEVAEQAKLDAESVQSKADAIRIDVNGLVSDVTTINGTVSSISSKANEAYNKANAVESRTATLETSVTGLTGRITDVESTATSTTKKLNELVVTVDGQKQTIATVTTTANSALSKVNVLESTVDGVTQTLTSVEEWQDDFNISTRNMLTNTSSLNDARVARIDAENSYNGNASAKATFSSNYVDTYAQKTNSIPRDGVYTVTFWAKADRELTTRNYFYGSGTTIKSANSDGHTGTASDGNSLLQVTTEWKRYWITWEQRNATAIKEVLLGRLMSAGTVWINSPMLVEGIVPTDWNPAPEDKAQTTMVNQIESTVEGTIQTVASVKNTADSALTKATQVETTANGLKTTISSVETTANSALTKATQVESTANGIRQTVTEVQSQLGITDIKTALAGGLVITDDPEFRKGNNGLIVYNNANNGVVTLTRESVVSGGTQPTNSNARMKVTVTGSANPQFGGILRLTQSRVNAKFVIRFTALLPIGRRFMHANNSIGDGARVTWLTSTAGTGLWTEYMYLVECGTGGTFSTFGHLYVLDGTVPTAVNPLNWYIARYEIIDISQSQQSQITQLSDNINLKVEKNDIVNQINISTEGILISGSKVQITGQTYIENGVIGRAQIANLAVGTAQIADAAITDAKIGSLSATKITTGTLNAANVNIVNLNASSISTGELTGINIRAATFYGSSGSGDMQLNGVDLRFDTSSNSFRLNYNGIVNVNTSYGTRALAFFNEGINIAASSSNSGNFRNSGLTLSGDSTYVDFYSIGSTSANGRLLYSGNSMTLNNFRTGKRISLANNFDLYVSSLNVHKTNDSDWSGVYAASFTNSSERRLKTNLVLLKDSLSVLQKMKFYEYDRIDTLQHQLGPVLDEAPEKIIQGQGIDQYSFITLVATSLQEHAKKTSQDIDMLALKIDNLLNEFNQLRNAS